MVFVRPFALLCPFVRPFALSIVEPSTPTSIETEERSKKKGKTEKGKNGKRNKVERGEWKKNVRHNIG